MKTVRLTMAQALVRWLTQQYIETDGSDGNGPDGNGETEKRVFAGLFGIFGHGNVTCLGEALERVQDALPTWRGQNEQTMALAAIAYSKAMRRKRMMIAASSVGPGATNMVTAAGVALANRLPVLFLAGDTFVHRRPDPVLQQAEHFSNPGITVNDAFKPVVRYWDRITHGEQLMQTMPQALATMLDPADCGPAFIGLPQDIQAQAYDFPEAFFERKLHLIAKPRADTRQITRAVAVLGKAERPVIISGGGVIYSGAMDVLAQFAADRNIPVVETVAGKAALLDDHPNYMGPVGVTGSDRSNDILGRADAVLAVGTRLQDFTTGSWTVFAPDFKLVCINTARFDAVKHGAVQVVGDAKCTLEELDGLSGSYKAPDAWMAYSRERMDDWRRYRTARGAPSNQSPVSYAQAVTAVSDFAQPQDRIVAAAGGLPGELNMLWRSRAQAGFDCEYGYSCMGYEIAGGWGAAMAQEEKGAGGETFVMTGDGSYLMANSDIYSTVLSGHKMIVIVCDNGGYAVINRLQVGKGGAEFNNLIESSRRRVEAFSVDFAMNAQSQGAAVERVSSVAELKEALVRAKASDKTYVISIAVAPDDWTEGGCFWEVGVPEVSPREGVTKARDENAAGKTKQRIGV